MHLLAKLVVIALLPIASAFAGESQTAIMDLEKKTATVKFDPAKTNTEGLVQATAKAGFPSTVRK